MKHCLIGADPELFLTDPKGRFVSAVGKIGGTKVAPRPIPGLPDGFAVQEDNVAVEFNIPPSDDCKTFVKSIQSAMDYIEDFVGKLNLKTSIVPSAVFPQKELQTDAARRFGCEPDFNIWALSENPAPRAKNKRLRSAGGHGHVAFKDDWIGLGRACDLFVGCPSIMFDPDTQRRLLYGKAGAVRKKDYGVEYRTLSNFWIKRPDWTEMIFNQFQQAVAFVRSGKDISDDDAKQVIACINNSDQAILRDLTVRYGLQY